MYCNEKEKNYKTLVYTKALLYQCNNNNNNNNNTKALLYQCNNNNNNNNNNNKGSMGMGEVVPL